MTAKDRKVNEFPFTAVMVCRPSIAGSTPVIWTTSPTTKLCPPAAVRMALKPLPNLSVTVAVFTGPGRMV